MRKIQFTIALLLGLQVSLTATAQNEKINLRVPNFARPLVEKWIQEYTKTTHDLDFQFVSGKSTDSNNTLQFVIDHEQRDNAVFFARYAVLPVTTKASEAEQVLGSRKLNAKKLKNLFFVKDEFDEDGKETKAEKTLHVYTGNSPLSASRTYAAHFKQETADFKGKKISGDDRFLNTALNRDPLGVTINSLSYIFDLNNRQLQPELALVPLDIDKQGKNILDEGNLDHIITLLEQQRFDEIPIGKIGIDFDHTNNRLNAFVRWILTYGKEYVHEYGLLQLSSKELALQMQHISQKEFAQK